MRRLPGVDRSNIQASRFAQPNKKRFTVRRMLPTFGSLNFSLHMTACHLTRWSIMEFRDGKVACETQYFGDPFGPGPSRVQWVEPIG
jgi:hypothetical protein